jgi:hypothetical protein
MTYRRLCRQSVSSVPAFFNPQKTKRALAVVTLFFTTAACLAQDQPQTRQPNGQSNQTQSETNNTVTIPAGTQIALVLTQPVQSRRIRRGDDIYAQITSPVSAGNEVAIPPGTFVQGTVDKIERRDGRGELRLQSMSITFPDGYVAPVAGPVILESPDGYALKDPGKGRLAGMFILPAAGAGVGALIGNAVANKNPSTLTSSLPPGCSGPPPGCLSSSVSVPAHPGMAIGIGTGVGAMAGMVASLVFLSSTHNFFLDVGSPVEMTLQQPIILNQDEVAEAVRQSARNPVAEQPIAPRPQFIPPPYTPANHGTCFTPGTPGTPDTVIPGPPGPNGIPGPPTIIPGMPGTPPTPYPCP